VNFAGERIQNGGGPIEEQSIAGEYQGAKRRVKACECAKGKENNCKKRLLWGGVKKGQGNFDALKPHKHRREIPAKEGGNYHYVMCQLHGTPKNRSFQGKGNSQFRKGKQGNV